jgi:hypothetical protein
MIRSATTDAVLSGYAEECKGGPPSTLLAAARFIDRKAAGEKRPFWQVHRESGGLTC